MSTITRIGRPDGCDRSVRLKADTLHGGDLARCTDRLRFLISDMRKAHGDLAAKKTLIAIAEELWPMEM